MLGNGVPLLTSLRISRDAIGNVLLEEAVDEAAESVKAGESLAGPLAASGAFAEEIVEMVSVGESANNLAEVLITVADTLEDRADRVLAIIVRLVEPATLLLLGGVVFFIFMALVVPMLRMSSAL
jgi:general secretion pathway protein F/type IV pilus assembly protein PilC